MTRCGDCGLPGVDASGNVPCPNCGSTDRQLDGSDAGERCVECGSLITWTDHLPPARAGGRVRCFAAETLERLEARQSALADRARGYESHLRLVKGGGA